MVKRAYCTSTLDEKLKILGDIGSKKYGQVAEEYGESRYQLLLK